LALYSGHWSVAGEDDIRIIAGFEAGLNIRFFFGVRRADCIGCSFGSFESVSHGESNVLTVVSDFVVFEWRPAFQTNTIKAWRRSGTKEFSDIPAMKDRPYARHFLCRCRIKREQFAIRDRGFHRHGVQHSGKIEI